MDEKGTGGQESRQDFYSGKYRIGTIFNQIDLFGRPVPSFTLKNQQKITSIVGGLFTLFITCMMLMYGSIKWRELATKSNPLITQAVIQNEFDSSQIVNLNDRNFRIAFAVTGAFDNNSRDDPRFVKWFARIFGQHKQKKVDRILPPPEFPS